MYNRKPLSSLLLAFAIALTGLSPGLAALKGGVQEDATLNNQPAPGLSRQDMGNQPDAFSSEPPPGQPDFNVATVPMSMPPPPPKPPFNLKAQQEGGDGFDPRFMAGQGTPDNRMMQQPPQGFPPPGFQQNPNLQSEEANPDMKILWDQWHHRVAQAIYAQYTNLTRAAGYGMRHRPLACNIDYVVSRTGVVSAQVLQPSPDPVYNTICLGAVTSLNGQVAFLQFPQGSRRNFVEKPANFTENVYAGINGFRYLQGDGETVKLH